MTTVAFQVDEFQSVLKQADGSYLRSSERPPMSFDYEVLTFTNSQKTRFWNNQSINLTQDEIAEVQAYIDTIEADDNLSETMAQIHQSKKILAATDWYVVRKMEIGTEIPENITLMRTKAREPAIEFSNAITAVSTFSLIKLSTTSLNVKRGSISTGFTK